MTISLIKVKNDIQLKNLIKKYVCINLHSKRKELLCMGIHYFLEVLGGKRDMIQMFLSGMFFISFNNLIKIILLPGNIIAIYNNNVNDLTFISSLAIIWIFFIINELIFNSIYEMRIVMSFGVFFMLLGLII